MPAHTDVHAVSADVVLAFLKETMPFKELEEETLLGLAKQCQIDFYPKGTLIFKQGTTQVKYLYLIQKGGVKIFLRNEDGEISLKDFRGEGEYFGALPIIQDTRANLNVETVEDTFCFLFSKEAFLELLHSAPRVTRYYLRSISEKMIPAYAELRNNKVTPRKDSSLLLFNTQVGDIIKDRLWTIGHEDSVQNAAGQMARFHIGSLLVRGREGDIVGIITDKDLRTKVVAVGLDYQTPVSRIMTAPVRRVPYHAMCFDALLKMMGNRIHHLAVERHGQIIGVVTTHDVMVLQGSSPIFLFREIAGEQTFSGLYTIAKKIPQVVRALIEEGAKANNITRMITILNDQILEKLLTLLLTELGPPPVRFCWLLFGSEGRREQTFMTDQDNAIIYETVTDQSRAQEVAEYFRILSEKAIEHLVNCGYPRCPGDMMASNPKWRQPLEVWKSYFDAWIYKPEPEEVLNATIFFDFRAGFGAFELADSLRDHLMARTAKQDIFILQLAKNCLHTRPPLSFFRNFIVEKDGEHRNQLDLKKRSLVPFVDFARLMALRWEVRETNTLGRLLLLHEAGRITRELYIEMMEAYEFIMQLRLVHQLHLLEQGNTPDNYLNPGDLSDLEKKTLKEAFAVVQRLQSFLISEFRLEST